MYADHPDIVGPEKAAAFTAGWFYLIPAGSAPFVLASTILGWAPAYLMLLPVALLLLGLSADKKRSRGCAIGVAFIQAVAIYIYISETHVPPGSEHQAFRFDIVAPIAGCILFVQAILFSTQVDERYRRQEREIHWPTLRRLTRVTLMYLVFSWIAVGFVGSALYEPVRSASVIWTELLTVFSVIVPLAVWRRLPGTHGIPPVVPRENRAGIVVTDPFAEEANPITMVADIPKADADGRIVSPTGIYGKSFRLSIEQFGQYQEGKWVRKGLAGWGWGAFLAVMALGLGFGGPSDHNLASTFFSGLIVTFLTVVVVGVRRKTKDFHKAFPRAPVARLPDSRMDRLCYSIGVRIFGGDLIAIFSVPAFFLLVALVVLALLSGPDTWGVVLMFGCLALLALLLPPIGMIGRRRFQERYGCPLTPKNLLAALSGELRYIPHV